LDAREAGVTPRGENAFCGYISFFGLAVGAGEGFFHHFGDAPVTGFGGGER